MRSLIYILIFCLAFFLNCTIEQSSERSSTDSFRVLEDNSIINLYDAFGEQQDGLIKDFGFSALVRFKGKTILFDGGTNADIFKNNVEALNIDLSAIDFVVASHSHFDHINGFDHLLKVNPDVKIYFPFDLFWGANIPYDLTGTDSTGAASLDKRMQYFDGDYRDYQFRQSGRFWNANIEFVSENMEVSPGISLIATTSDNMGYFNKYPSLGDCQDCDTPDARLNGLRELSLSLEGSGGEILFVGCSHSTVEKIIREGKSFTENDLAMVYGGFHLLPYDKNTLVELSQRLKNEHEVRQVAPAHCTGHLAFKTLKEAFQKNYLYAGLGTTIRF